MNVVWYNFNRNVPHNKIKYVLLHKLPPRPTSLKIKVTSVAVISDAWHYCYEKYCVLNAEFHTCRLDQYSVSWTVSLRAVYPNSQGYTTGFVSKVGKFMMTLISEMINQES